MRTLKVRAWDDRNKRFGYITIQANMVAWPSNLWISQVSHDDEGVRFDDVTDWQQYTGLLDKNGREIYEGDIVHGNAEANFVVVPMCGGLSIHPLRNLGQKHNELIASPTNDPQTASWLGDSEVIGNIHENGDLLNG